LKQKFRQGKTQERQLAYPLPVTISDDMKFGADFRSS